MSHDGVRVCIHYASQIMKRIYRKISLDSLPNYKILDRSKLKAFADDKIYKNKKLKFGLERIENVGKRRKCWLPAFSPSPTMFLKTSSFRIIKSWDCMVKI